MSDTLLTVHGRLRAAAQEVVAESTRVHLNKEFESAMNALQAALDNSAPVVAAEQAQVRRIEAKQARRGPSPLLLARCEGCGKIVFGIVVAVMTEGSWQHLAELQAEGCRVEVVMAGQEVPWDWGCRCGGVK